jgi:lysophospholipase L1-like esterase
MCAPKPYGPNMHPNAAGYLKIAAAIESELQPPW